MLVLCFGQLLVERLYVARGHHQGIRQDLVNDSNYPFLFACPGVLPELEYAQYALYKLGANCGICRQFRRAHLGKFGRAYLVRHFQLAIGIGYV